MFFTRYPLTLTPLLSQATQLLFSFVHVSRFFILRLFSIVVLESRIRLFDREGSACEARRNAIEVDECVGLAL